MTRTIVMIRHAKSSWANPLQSDFDRPLNERGEHDAPMMGERLKKLGILPDCIVSSTAKRAKQTARRLAESIGFDKEKIQYGNKLYHCIPAVFEEVIRDVSNEIKTLFIVAHNPGLTDFANELSKQFRIDNVPTCSVVVAQIEAEEWSDFLNATKKVILFEYPKKPQ